MIFGGCGQKCKWAWDSIGRMGLSWEEWMNLANFLHTNTCIFKKAKSYFNIYWVDMVKNMDDMDVAFYSRSETAMIGCISRMNE